MNVKLVRHHRDELEARRRKIVERMETDERTLRVRAEAGVLTPDERDVLLELDGIDFLPHRAQQAGLLPSSRVVLM